MTGTLGKLASENVAPWKPPPGVEAHSGGPLPEGMEFFAPPPDGIGQVISAQTSLKEGQRELSWNSRFLLYAGLFVAAYCIFVYGIPALVRLPGPKSSVLIEVLGVAAGGVACSIAIMTTRFRCEITYVGQLGMAVIRLSGSKKARPVVTMFRFTRSAYLRTGFTRFKGELQYVFAWFMKHDRRPVFRLAGQLVGLGRPVGPQSRYHFAVRGEEAWCQFRLQSLTEELEEQGAVEFPIGERRTVRLSQGVFEVVLPEGKQKMAVDEMGDVTISNGVVTFKHKDAKWYSGQGKFSFSYAEIPNAKLFLLCLDKLLGIRSE